MKIFKILTIVLIVIFPLVVSAQKIETLSILTDSTASDTLNVAKGYYLSALIMPAGLATALTVKVSDVGTTMYPLQISDADSGAYTIETDYSAAQAMLLDKDSFYPWKYFQFTSNKTATADKTLKFILEKK